MYGTDHSVIFSTQVTTHCTVHIITYRYKWISYPLYSKHDTGVLLERRGIEYNITRTVNVIVTVRHSTVYYKKILSQPMRPSTETVHVLGTSTEQLGNRE
jgi:hypothetical protein